MGANIGKMVSVLIPAYNAEAWIEETIHSVLAQTWPYLEIIIVDDGSGDNTLQKAKKFENKGVKVLSQKNKGASAARNIAFSASSGDFIQYLDADDLLAPDKIEIQMKNFKNLHEPFVSSSAWGMFYNCPEEATFKPSKLWLDFLAPVEWLTIAWTEGVWMQPSAWLTPRKLVEEAGTWNEELSLHDDGEFFSRVVLKSKGVIFCSQAKSFYRKGIQSSLSSQKTLKGIQSHFKVCELYEQHLLKVENSPRTRHACAVRFQEFIYDHYPYFPEYLHKASLQVTRLGGTAIKPSGSPVFMRLKKFLGWKLAKRIEDFAYKHNLNRSAIRKKIKFTIYNKD